MKDINTLEVALEDIIDKISITALKLTTTEEKTRELKCMMHTLKAVQEYLNNTSDDINLF